MTLAEETTPDPPIANYLSSVVDRLESEVAKGQSSAKADPLAVRPGDAARYTDLFFPFATENAALSPDGKRVAYSRRVGEELWVVIVNLADPETPLAQVMVVTDSGATPVLRQRGIERVPGRIEWMGWVTSERLVLQTNQVFVDYTDSGNWKANAGAVVAMNADGSDAGYIATPKEVARRQGQGFDALRPEIASNAFLRPDGTSMESTILDARTVAGDIGVPTTDASARPPNNLPRSLAIVDYNPQKPDEIWVRAGPINDFDLYGINVFTGKKRLLRTERLIEGKGPLLNRQQQAEVAVMNTTRTDFPHHYLHERIFPRWGKMNKLVADPDSVDFTLGPHNVLADRSYPLGFDEDPNVLYFASDVGQDRFGIYGLNMSSGEFTGLKMEHPTLDLSPPQLHDFTGRHYLVFDRFTRSFLGVRLDANYRTAVWLRPDWQALQTRLEDTFPGKSVDILEWDETYRRFLVRVQGPIDPGSFFVYDTEADELIEFALVAPYLQDRNDAWTASFTFETDSGREPLARLTVPTKPVTEPIPLIILCRDNFWDRLPVEFDREAMALARMGYVVAQFNGLGAWGFGRESRIGIRDGYELAQAREIVALVSAIEERFAINPEKVALMGEGLGGFLALRTLQEFPEHFRTAIAINAPFNLNEWVQEARWGAKSNPEGAKDVELIVPYLGDDAHFKTAPLVDSPQRMIRPVQLFAFRREDGPATSPDYNHAYALARSLRRQGLSADLIDLHPDYARGLPHARARVFAEIAAFLDTHLFRYEVEPGALEFDMEEDVNE